MTWFAQVTELTHTHTHTSGKSGNAYALELEPVAESLIPGLAQVWFRAGESGLRIRSQVVLSLVIHPLDLEKKSTEVCVLRTYPFLI